jgi:hypothetical protein
VRTPFRDTYDLEKSEVVSEVVKGKRCANAFLKRVSEMQNWFKSHLLH